MKVVDAESQVMTELQYPVTQGAVGSETSATMRDLLESVVAEGGGSKAQIEEIYMACPEGDGRTELLVQRGGTNLLAALLYFGIMCLLQVAILYMAGPSAIQYLMTMAGA